MRDWQIDVMKDLCEITSSKRIYASDYQPEGIPFYRGKEIIEKFKGNLEVSKQLFISEKKYFEIKEKFGIPQPGDLLLTSVGTIGIPYIIKPGESFYFKDGNLTWFRHFKNINSRFLYYWLLSPLGKAELKKCTIGSSQSAFTIVLLKSMKIKIPHIRLQHRIARILSVYDELIENNARRIKILEEMAQRIYREWFVHFRYPGHENQKLVDSELGPIPEGWEIKNIGEIIKFSIGGGWGKEDSVGKYLIPAYVIRGTDIPPGKHGNFNKCPLRYHLESNFVSRKLMDGDLVFEVSGGSKDQPLGRTLLINNKVLNAFNVEVICASFCKLIRPDENIINSEYIYLHLREIYENRMITKYQVQSTGISNFKFTTFLYKHKLIIPPKILLDQFMEILAGFFVQIQILGNQNNVLSRTRDLLLPKLISGKIDVSDLDIGIEE